MKACALVPDVLVAVFQGGRQPAVRPGGRGPGGAAALLPAALRPPRPAAGRRPDVRDADHIWSAGTGLRYRRRLGCAGRSGPLLIISRSGSPQQLPAPTRRPTPLPPRPVPALPPSNITGARPGPPSTRSPRLQRRRRPSPPPPAPRWLRPARPRRRSLPSPQRLPPSAHLRSCPPHPPPPRGPFPREHPLHPLSPGPSPPPGPPPLRFPRAITAARCRPPHPRRTTRAPHPPVLICPLLPWLRATTCLRALRGRRACLGRCSRRRASLACRTVGVRRHAGVPQRRCFLPHRHLFLSQAPLGKRGAPSPATRAPTPDNRATEPRRRLPLPLPRHKRGWTRTPFPAR